MKVLVIKSTPEKIRHDLFLAGDTIESLISGRIFDIGSENPQHVYKYGERGRAEGSTFAANHDEAFQRLAAALASPTTGREDYTQNLSVIAHRVPHGGQRFKGPELINEDVLKDIDALSPFAPRGNPASLAGIQAAAKLFPGVPQVAVFDTAFFQALPPEAYLYPVPRQYHDQYGFRRFGFHGTSHRYSITTACGEMGSFPEALKIISIHLGEESSAVAYNGGRCSDVTTGLSTQAGIPGATNSGTIDPAALTYLMRTNQFSPDQLDYFLARQCGMLGLSGVSANILEVIDEASKGNERCDEAVKVLVFNVIKAIGSLIAVMGGLDLLVFTGSAAERSSRLRREVCERLENFGISIDHFRNDGSDGTKIATVSKEDSKVTIYVIPGDEERTIVRESLALVSRRDQG